jgi:hypothetical protein
MVELHLSRVLRGVVPESTDGAKWSKEESNVWEQAVEDQRHFNGLIIQSRTVTNAVYAAITAVAIGLAPLHDGLFVAGGIMAALAAFMAAMTRIDAYYWSLLIGAVEYAELLERRSGLPIVEKEVKIKDTGGKVRWKDRGKTMLIRASGPSDYIHQRVNEKWARWTISLYDVALLIFSLALSAVLFGLAYHVSLQV